MKLNTMRQIPVGTGRESRWDYVPDVYLIPETVQDAYTLDELYKAMKGKTLAFEPGPGENPALLLRLVDLTNHNSK